MSALVKSTPVTAGLAQAARTILRVRQRGGSFVCCEAAGGAKLLRDQQQVRSQRARNVRAIAAAAKRAKVAATERTTVAISETDPNGCATAVFARIRGGLGAGPGKTPQFRAVPTGTGRCATGETTLVSRARCTGRSAPAPRRHR